MGAARPAGAPSRRCWSGEPRSPAASASEARPGAGTGAAAGATSALAESCSSFRLQILPAQPAAAVARAWNLQNAPAGLAATQHKRTPSLRRLKVPRCLRRRPPLSRVARELPGSAGHGAGVTSATEAAAAHHGCASVSRGPRKTPRRAAAAETPGGSAPPAG